jgi:hypothetical protein
MATGSLQLLSTYASDSESSSVGGDDDEVTPEAVAHLQPIADPSKSLASAICIDAAPLVLYSV